VLKIEYYPRKLFSDPDETGTDDEPRSQAADKGDELERKFNKVALVTMWIDPEEHQIVKYTFDNVSLDFLPLRSMVRVDEVRASMVMGQPIQHVWLPDAITVTAGVTLANGSYDAIYERRFLDYRQGEVKARIRSYSFEER
jgi:hypothetical protein